MLKKKLLCTCFQGKTLLGVSADALGGPGTWLVYLRVYSLSFRGRTAALSSGM